MAIASLRCRIRSGWSKVCCRRKSEFGIQPVLLNPAEESPGLFLLSYSFPGPIPDQQREIPRGRLWAMLFFGKFPLNLVHIPVENNLRANSLFFCTIKQ